MGAFIAFPPLFLMLTLPYISYIFNHALCERIHKAMSAICIWNWPRNCLLLTHSQDRRLSSGSSRPSQTTTAMSYVTLLLLQLVYSGRATVQSSFTPYGQQEPDAQLFLQHQQMTASSSSFPTNPHLVAGVGTNNNTVTNNASCEDFVYMQARMYLSVRYASLEKSVQRISHAVLAGDLSSFDGDVGISGKDEGDKINFNTLLTPWILDSALTSIWLLAEYDVRVLEATFTIQSQRVANINLDDHNNDGKHSDDDNDDGDNDSNIDDDDDNNNIKARTGEVITFAWVQRSKNGSLHVVRNWNNNCLYNFSSNIKGDFPSSSANHTDTGEFHYNFSSQLECLSMVKLTSDRNDHGRVSESGGRNIISETRSDDIKTGNTETETGNTETETGNTLPPSGSSGGYWKVFCFDQSQPAEVKFATFVYNTAGMNLAMTGSPHTINQTLQNKLRMTITITLDMSEEQLNQCEITAGSTASYSDQLDSLRHKCRPSTTCVNENNGRSSGLRFGAYECHCNPDKMPPPATKDSSQNNYFSGNYKNKNSSSASPSRVKHKTFFHGLELEHEYHAFHTGVRNAYTMAYDCVQCHTACDWPFCIRDTCSLMVDAKFRIPILSLTLLTMIGVLVLMGFTFKYRNDKMMRASTPGLLSVTLIGTFLLYTEVVVAAFQSSAVTCMLVPWIRHVGFSLAYGGMLFKTWRISIIMRVFKSRAFKTRDSALYWKITLMTVTWMTFLVAWTIFDPLRPVHPVVPSQAAICSTNAWSYLGFVGEVGTLVWGACLCYQARKAPNLYNETQQVSYAIWNESIWEVFHILARFLLHLHPDPNILLLVGFLRTQLTVSVLLLLIYTPKFIRMFRKIRQVNGTLTDVYGPRKVHRLSLMVNKHGNIKTIYCTPCGPLAYMDKCVESEDSSHESHNKAHIKEDEYSKVRVDDCTRTRVTRLVITAVCMPVGKQACSECYALTLGSKAEVDSLIELVSRLKSEREQYKMQVKRLLQLLHSSKRTHSRTSSSASGGINGLSPSLVAEDPEGNQRELDEDGLEIASDCDDLFPEIRPRGGASGTADGTSGHVGAHGGQVSDEFFRYPAAVLGPRNSRASTMTTFVSSSTADDTSVIGGLTGSRLGFVPDQAALDPVDSCSDVLAHAHNSTGSVDDCTISSPSPNRRKQNGCSRSESNSCATSGPRNGISRYALTVLTRKLAQNHLIGGGHNSNGNQPVDLSSSPETLDALSSADTEFFPHVLHSHDNIENNRGINDHYHHQGRGVNNSVSLLHDLVPSVYGDLCDTLLGRQVRKTAKTVAPSQELHKLASSNTGRVYHYGQGAGNQRTFTTHTQHDVGQLAAARTKQKTASSEKLNFIMYI